MTDPTDKILTSLYTLLNNTITVTQTSGSGNVNVPFYTFPKNDTSYPYITVATIDVVADTDKTAFATEVVVNLDVVTSYASDVASAKQANAIADAVLDKLNHKSKLSLTGLVNWNVRLEASNLLNEVSQSQRIVRKIMRFRLGVWEG